MKTVFVDVGTRVTRKRDGATGVVVDRRLAVPSVAHPGIYGKTVLGIRLDDVALAKAAGGDMVGDLSWFTSNFRVDPRGCLHNAMRERTGDATRAWECADCGYVYGGSD